jgi:hypothetical protein
MPRKKKEETEEEKVVTTKTVKDLIPIAELLKNESTILGERSEGTLPRNAEFSPKFLEIATRLIAAGLTEKDLAYIVGTTPARIRYWKRHNDLFKKACEAGRQMAKSFLIGQGLKAAAGYDYVEKNYKVKRKILNDGTVVEYPSEESHFHKHQKPDSTLLMFMLCNMSRQLKDETPWASQHKIEVDESKKVSIEIKGSVVSSEIDRLAGAFRPDNIIEAEVVNEKDGNNTEKSRRLPEGDTKGHTK